MLISVAAPSGENPKRHQREYDVLGRFSSVCEVTNAGGAGSCGQQTSATGFLTSYTYDPLGNLMNVSQSGQTRSFSYDGLSRMLSETHPETSSSGSGGTTYYVYDSISSGNCSGTYNGDKVKRTDPANNVTCYTWDGLHRLTGVSYPSGPNSPNTGVKTFVYDSATPYGIPVTNPYGRLTAAYTTAGGNITTAQAFGYNARGETSDFWENNVIYYNNWYHVQQRYFANGVASAPQGFNETGTTYPFSHQLGYTLDGKGRPFGIWDASWSNTVIWASTNYTSADQPTGVSLMAGAESFSYDANSDRMTQWASTAHSYAQTGNLTWNANGTLKQLQISDNYNSANNGQTCLYGYDDLARLLNANCGSTWSQTFAYDVFGNITKTGSLNFQNGYGSGNHVSGFSYDGMGNVTLDNLGNSYSYDAEGRPLTAAGVQTYYDAFNRAVSQNRNGAYTQIVYSPSGQKFALMNGWYVQQYFVPLAAGLQAVYNGSGLQYYRHADWVGNSRFAATPTGSMYYDGAYAPFGENYAETGTTDRSFTGQTQDTTPGLYDFLFRQQSSSQGRWLVPDPAGLAAVDLTNPQTWNRYAYVGNNPLNTTDPLGLYCAIGVDGGIIGGCTEGDIWIGGTFFPWWWEGSSGAGGGGHTNPPPGNPPPSPPPPSQPPPQPVNFPNETLGIPNGLNVNFGGVWGAILPSAICGDMGPCKPLGSGYQAAPGLAIGGSILCQLIEPMRRNRRCRVGDRHPWACNPNERAQ